jgi:hypothetical protein
MFYIYARQAGRNAKRHVDMVAVDRVSVNDQLVRPSWLAQTRYRCPTSPQRIGNRYFVTLTIWYSQSQTVWLPHAAVPCRLKAQGFLFPSGMYAPDRL